jgi:hypothetical protein
VLRASWSSPLPSGLPFARRPRAQASEVRGGVSWGAGSGPPKILAAGTRPLRHATEVILEANDVVLAEVLAVLHLDENEVIGSGVLDPV